MKRIFSEGVFEIGLAILLTLAAIGVAFSHDEYKGWTNQQGKMCCNEHDCAPAESRYSPRGVEVLVEGEWCPVQAKHYRSDNKGPHPEWGSPHACVCKGIMCYHFQINPEASPCERLVCYEPPRAGS